MSSSRRLATQRGLIAEIRTRKIRAVLAACRRKGLDDDARKDLQQEITGVASMADMDEAQLGRLLDHLNRDYQGSAPQRPHLAKVKALWWSLYWLGAIEDPSDRALSSFVHRQTGIAALRFLDHSKASSVIEALKDWLDRERVNWLSDSEIADLSSAWPGRGRAEWDRWSVIRAIHSRLFQLDIVKASAEHYAAKALGLTTPPTRWTVRELDDVIRVLGKKWRACRP